MEFSIQTEKTIKELFPLFETCAVYKEMDENGYETRKDFNKMAGIFFNDMVRAERYAKTLEIKGTISDFSLDTSQSLIHGHGNKFLPIDVSRYIEKRSKCILTYRCIVNKIKITIHFILFHDIMLFMEESRKSLEEYDLYAKNMLTWLYLCSIYSYSKNTCVNELVVNVFLTPLTRKLPVSNEQILGPAHINGAYTYCCKPSGKIYIFRKEDWFKVFIHETFHAFGLDFCSTSSTDLKNTTRSIFNINSEFNIDEAYSETWAVIYHSVFISYLSMKRKNLSEFTMNLDACLQTERLYKLFQCNKILDFMGLKYEDLYDGAKKPLSLKLYREETNVFSYCVLTCVFLNDYISFLKWCFTNNTKTEMVSFAIRLKTLNEFGGFIKKQYKSKTLLDCLKYADELLIANKVKKNDFMLYRTNMAVFEM
jgi:hypothetical protein